MPRKARIDYPGGVHHLIVRGIERKRIFQDVQDRNAFLDRLGFLLLESKTSCLAWALLSNHVHLLVRTGVISQADLMRRLLTGYAVTYNRRYRRHGILFQNRYKSILCQEDLYLLELVRDVHLNPLRGKRVESLEALEQYPYTDRSVVSYWAVREPGVSGTKVARRLGVTQPAVSQAVKRGARIIEERHLKLKED
jgi:putative transposase